MSEEEKEQAPLVISVEHPVQRIARINLERALRDVRASGWYEVGKFEYEEEDGVHIVTQMLLQNENEALLWRRKQEVIE